MSRPPLVAVAVLLSVSGCQEDRLVSAYALSSEQTVSCEPGDFTLAHATPEVMLVLDRSTSMSSSLGTGTRWSTLVDALEHALPAVDAQMALGLTLFPAASTTAAECRVPDAPESSPAIHQVSALLAQVRSSTLVGGTPTAAALDVAASGFLTTGPRALVLATDGLPNCNAALNPASCACPSGNCSSAVRCIDDARTLERLSALAETGIPTWVIGIGGDVTGSALLDAMAVAGGRPAASSPKYVSALSASELQAAFTRIRDELAACTFTSPSVPDEGGALVVMLDGVIVPHDASGSSGWSWSRQASGELVLRGAWCEKAIAATDPVLRVSVTCGVDDVSDSGADDAGLAAVVQ